MDCIWEKHFERGAVCGRKHCFSQPQCDCDVYGEQVAKLGEALFPYYLPEDLWFAFNILV